MKTIPWLLGALVTLAGSSGKSSDFTNCVAVTTNLTFFLRGWTNYLPQLQFLSNERIHYNLAATGTNTVYHRRLPTEQAFDFKLTDERGREMPKTKLGKEYSQPPRPPKSRWDIFKLKPQAVRYEPRELFCPDEMFVITNKGVYELQVRIRLCVPMTNGVPDGGAMLDLRQFTLNKDFGVVVSEPVCVKVIKD